MASKEKNPADRNEQVYLIFGDNDLRRSEATRKLVDALCPQESRGLGLETVNGECDNAEQAVSAIKQSMQALQTVGFLSAGKTVWLKDAGFLGTNMVSKAAAVKDALSSFAELIGAGLAQGCQLVISAEKVFKGSAFYKCCAKCGRVEEFKLAAKSKQRAEEARAQAARMFAQNKIKLSEPILEAFIGRCGTDGHQVAREVDKLSAYLGEGDALSLDDISLLTTPAAEAEYWELSDSIAKRQTERALKLLREQIDKGASAIAIVSGIEKILQQLLLIRECMRLRLLSIQRNQPLWKEDPQTRDLLDAAFLDRSNDLRKMHNFRVAMLAKDAQRYSRAELRRGLHETVATHEMLVSRSLPADLLLEMLIVKISSG